MHRNQQAGEGHGTEGQLWDAQWLDSLLWEQNSLHLCCPGQQGHLQALALCSEDTCACSKLNRAQPDRGEQVTVSSMEQGQQGYHSQKFVCSTSNASACMFKVKGKVRPQLADLPGEAHEAAAPQRCTTGHG